MKTLIICIFISLLLPLSGFSTSELSAEQLKELYAYYSETNNCGAIIHKNPRAIQAYYSDGTYENFFGQASDYSAGNGVYKEYKLRVGSRLIDTKYITLKLENNTYRLFSNTDIFPDGKPWRGNLCKEMQQIKPENFPLEIQNPTNEI